MVGARDKKIVCFQALTGLEDSDLCTEILVAHDWDLESAISTFTGDDLSSSSEASIIGHVGSSGQSHSSPEYSRRTYSTSVVDAEPNLAWRLVTLPISVISGSLGLISGAIGLGMWAAGGVLSHSLGMLRLGPGRRGAAATRPLVPVSAAVGEAMELVSAFEREFGSRTGTMPNFVPEGFMDALQRSRHAHKLLFVYLHSPDHPDTPMFCERTLCNDVVGAFLNENFVSWGGSIRASEGFKMSNSLKASRFPFCAVVMAATNQRISLLQQAEGPKSPEVLLNVLQIALEETGPVLVAARLEEEERRNNLRLREEQDAAYREALEADQAREQQRREEQERLVREAAEAEGKRREVEEAHERAAHEAVEQEAALARRRQEKALSLGSEPEKGPDVTQVLVRFPGGERKQRSFHRTATVQSLYDYVDTLDCLNVENYSLVSNFPRTVYGQDKLSLTLGEAGLHPQASLFVELS